MFFHTNLPDCLAVVIPPVVKYNMANLPSEKSVIAVDQDVRGTVIEPFLAISFHALSAAVFPVESNVTVVQSSSIS